MRALKQLVVGCLLLVPWVSSQATALAPGNVDPAPLEAPAPVTVLASLISPYLDGTFAGSVASWAVTGDPSNPYASGVSFYYQVSNTGTSYLGRFSASSFDSLPVDVRTISAAWDGALLAGGAPSFADRSITGNVVGFDYFGAAQVAGGGHTEIMVVHTPATTYITGLGAVINERADSVDVLAPIPEPETYAMLLAGLGLLGLFARRWKRNATA